MVTKPITSAYYSRRRGSISFGYTLDLEKLFVDANNLRQVTQVHGNRILDDADFENDQQQADGLVSASDGVVLVVKTADCVPVLASDGTRMIAVHAGWRGLKAGIVKNIADHLQPERSFAFIGPAVSTPCYEVDRDLYEPWLAEESALQQHLFPAPAGGTKRLLDTKAIAVRHLQEIGFHPAAIECSPTCTYRSGLPSWRREQPDKRRLFSFIRRHV